MKPDMLILLRSLVGVGVAIIGTGITLYLRLDSRIDWVYEKLDAKTDALAHEVAG